MMYIATDTETTGLPVDPYCKDKYDVANWPRIYQLGAILFDEMGFEYGRMNAFIKPDGWKIPKVDSFLKELGNESFHEKHNITTEYLMDVGVPLYQAVEEFIALANKSDARVFHNAAFDNPILVCEFFRKRFFPQGWDLKPLYCTKLLTENILKIPSAVPGRYKWPTLQEAYKHYYGKEFDDAHDAMADVQATMDVFLEVRQELNLD